MMIDSGEEKKLYLPNLCVVPLKVRLDRGVPDAAKVYLGELSVLANKFGYCYATDEQLAEMKGVCVRTIKKWHEILEKRGYIRRETHNLPYSEEEGKLRWYRQRKLYITEMEGTVKSNEKDESKIQISSAKVQKTALSSDGAEKYPTDRWCRKVPFINKITLKEEQQTAPSAPAVVFSDKLRKVGIPEFDKMWLARTYEMAVIDHAIDYALHPNTDIKKNLSAAIKWACREKPELPKTEGEKIEESRNYVKSLPIVQKEDVKVDILSAGVEIIFYGCQRPSVWIDYIGNKFKEQIVDHLNRNGLLASGVHYH